MKIQYELTLERVWTQRMQRPHRDADEIVGVRVETLILRSEATSTGLQLKSTGEKGDDG